MSLTDDQRAFSADLVLGLHQFTPEDRLAILVPLVAAQVRACDPDRPTQMWCAVLRSLLHAEESEVEALSAAIVSAVAQRHEIAPSLEGLLSTAEGLEAHVARLLDVTSPRRRD